jgi:hypothetical protein
VGKNAIPTRAQIRDLLAHLLAGVVGETEAAWRERIGEIEELPILKNLQCNWRAAPKGSAEQLDAIARAIEVVRGEHPYVR